MKHIALEYVTGTIFYIGKSYGLWEMSLLPLLLDLPRMDFRHGPVRLINLSFHIIHGGATHRMVSYQGKYPTAIKSFH